MRIRTFLLSVIPVIAVMVMIFCFSAQPADESSETSSHVADLVIRIAVRDYEKLSAAEQQSTYSRISLIVRKLAHFSEFFLLAVTMMMAVRIGYIVSLSMSNRYWMWTILDGVLYAASDEIHQAFVPGRSCSFTDVLIDSAGVVVGVLFMMLIQRKHKIRFEDPKKG